MDAIKFYKEIGHLIKSSRIKAEKSQEELAEEIGLSRVSIVNIEKGRQKIQLHNFVQAVEFLNIDIYNILPSVSQGNDLSENIKEKIGRKFTEGTNADSALDFVRITLLKTKKS